MDRETVGNRGLVGNRELALMLALLGALALSACGGPGDAERAAAVAVSGDVAAVVPLGPEITARVPIVTLVVPTVAPTTAPRPVRATAAGPALLSAGAYPPPGATAAPTVTVGPGTPTARPVAAAPTSAGRSGSTTGSGGGSSNAGSGGGSGNAGPTRSPKPTATPRPTVPTRTPAPTEDRSLATALRAGGYVVYLRHAVTDWDQNERELAWVPEMLEDRSLLADCDRQRLLSGEGRDQARAIGDRIRGQGIPVGRVLASPWCRTRDTAELAFGGADVAADKLFDTGYLTAGSDERTRFRDALRELLSEAPGGGTNTFIIGHMPQLSDAAGTQLGEGEAAIFEPGGDRKFRLIKRVGAEGWDNLGNR